MTQEENPPTGATVERAEDGRSSELASHNASAERFPSPVLRAAFPPDVEPQFHLTFFGNEYAKTKKEVTASAAQLRILILAQSAPRKEDLPWLKLAKFGDRKTTNGSLRHDANVEAVTGTEADYDGEKVPFEEIVSRVERARLAALVYTSPSHSEAKPRCRVLFPTSGPLRPEMRKKLAEVANDAIGGIAAQESNTLSQSYYYGHVTGNDPIKIEIVTGEFIDTRLPAHELIDHNPFLRAGEMFDFRQPIDTDARLAAMTFKGEGDAGVNRTQVQVTASLLNQGAPIDEVVEKVMQATRRVGPESWNWSQEERKVRRMCESWQAKLDAEAASVQVLSPSEVDWPVLDRRDPMVNARVMIRARFTDERGRRRFHRYRDGFWLHDGSCYREITDENVRSTIWKFLENARTRDKKGRIQFFKPDSATVSNVQDALTGACDLDSNNVAPWWIANAEGRLPAAEFLSCANGLLHLPSGVLHDATPELFNVVATLVSFDPSATAPEFSEFLRQLFGRDVQAVELLQEWFGYCLSADTSQQKIFLVIGPRRCGKGTIGRILRELLGKQSVAGPTMDGLGGTFGLEPLMGRSLATISDMKIGSKTNKALIAERLLSISGEDALDVNRKHRPALPSVLLSTRMMILSNDLPALPDASGALAGRYLVLNLTQSFYGREDTELTNKLKAEASGILNWALEGYRRLRDRGHFIQPDSSRQSIEEIELLGSPMAAFIAERCVVRPGAAVLLDELWIAYGVFMETDCGGRPPGNKVWFGRDLRTALGNNLTTRSIRQGTGRAVELVGIELQTRGTGQVMPLPSS